MPPAGYPAFLQYLQSGRVSEYESLAGAGVLKDPRVELIDGYFVRKMTKKPRHTTITEWLRDRLAETLPPGWHVRKEEHVRIPSFDEPEPDLTVAARRNQRL